MRPQKTTRVTFDRVFGSLGSNMPVTSNWRDRPHQFLTRSSHNDVLCTAGVDPCSARNIIVTCTSAVCGCFVDLQIYSITQLNSLRKEGRREACVGQTGLTSLTSSSFFVPGSSSATKSLREA